MNQPPDQVIARGKQVIASVNSLIFEVNDLKSVLQDLHGRLSEAKRFHEQLTHDIGVLKASIEVMKKVATLLTRQGLQTLQDMITQGLMAIYFDENYRCKMVISERGTSKTAEIYLIDGVKKVPLKDATGGGIQTVVSLIIRAYFIITLGLRPFMVIDEGLYALSQKYVKPLYEFLQSLRDNAGFTFVIVSHDPRSFEFADKTYNIEKGRIVDE